MEVKMPRGGFYVTLKCNLKCKLCAAHAPYYKDPWHPTIEALCTQADRFFELIAHIGHFSLTGGEPLLRKDLSVLVHRLKQYSSQIGVLELFTNGTCIPDDALLSAFQAYDGSIKFVIDDYGPTISTKAKQAKDKIKCVLPHAACELRDYYSKNMHCDGWVDWKVGRVGNKTEEEAKLTFEKCSLPQKLEFVSCVNNGVIYPCPQTRRCIELGLIPFDPDECIDLFDNSYSDSEIQARIKRRYSLPVLRACSFCDGQCDDSERYPPAEQMT